MELLFLFPHVLFCAAGTTRFVFEQRIAPFKDAALININLNNLIISYHFPTPANRREDVAYIWPLLPQIMQS